MPCSAARATKQVKRAGLMLEKDCAAHSLIPAWSPKADLTAKISLPQDLALPPHSLALPDCSDWLMNQVFS